jgi:hypothetical protein
MRVYKSRAPVEIEDGWFITSELLAALRADVEADGGHLVLVYVPGYFEINDRAWELLRLQHGLAEDKFERALPARRLAALAAERGIAFLDLREALRRDEGWRGRTYHPRDGHWNERGHAAVASELEAFLRARGWVPGCPG